MQEPMRSVLKQQIGITEEDLNRMPPGISKLLSAVPRIVNYRIIAEVTDAKYCFAGCKPGDKLVFGPQPLLNAQESTCPLCIGALAPMMERVHIMWDRLAEGLDPNDAWVTHSQCFDPGLDYGGLGCVHFRVYAEKPE
jgi:hypothetical protein